MKYYLDVNVVVELYKRDCKIENNKTYISRLTLSEMCKNLEKNFDRQKSQFEFIENSKIKIDWRNYEEIIHGEAFDINFISPNTIIEDFYFAALKNKNFACFKYSYIQHLMENFNCNDCQAAELVYMTDLSLINSHYNFKWKEMLSNKEYLSEKKIYEIKKNILKSLLIANFHCISTGELKGKEKREFRKTLKEYNGSIDLFLNCSAYYYKNIDTVERNDAPDLLHLSYLGKDDIFVTQDKKLKKLCDKVSNGNQVISIEEYFKRVNIDKKK